MKTWRGRPRKRILRLNLIVDNCDTKGAPVILESNPTYQNLMLREDVVEAVESGKFHIYRVSTVDEGIALLTGREAGERKPDGTYPEGTVNWGVQTRLHELAEKVKAFTMREKTSEDGRGQREKAQLKD